MSLPKKIKNNLSRSLSINSGKERPTPYVDVKQSSFNVDQHVADRLQRKISKLSPRQRERRRKRSNTIDVGALLEFRLTVIYYALFMYHSNNHVSNI